MDIHQFNHAGDGVSIQPIVAVQKQYIRGFHLRQTIVAGFCHTTVRKFNQAGNLSHPSHRSTTDLLAMIAGSIVYKDHAKLLRILINQTIQASFHVNFSVMYHDDHCDLCVFFLHFDITSTLIFFYSDF